MDIEGYQERTPQIVEVSGEWVRAFVGDEIPERAEALGLRSQDGREAFAAVRRHTGARTVEAMLLDPPAWLAEGLEVFKTGQLAHIMSAPQGTRHLDEIAFTAGPKADRIPFRLDAPSFDQLVGDRPGLTSGFEALDTLAPLADGGLNLVLDSYAGPEAFDILAARAHAASSPDAAYWLTGDDRPADWATLHLKAGANDQRQLTALRLLMSWATQLRNEGRDVLVCAELPPLSATGAATDVDTALGLSIGEVVDQLGAALASTRDGRITTLLRLPLHRSAAGIEYIIETMDVGDVDAQIFVDAEGRFDPHRSRSDADLDAEGRRTQQEALSVLSRAAAARDKLAMLGEFGVDERERAALARADALAESLVGADE